MKDQTPKTIFLGPKGEQRAFFTDLINLITNDYIFWRRNYFPKDPPALSYSAINSEEAHMQKGLFMDELFKLISDLKLDPPFFSPRYMAHMLGEVSLPSLLAYYATMLYNPNNVSLEASPVTIDFELKVGRDFAELCNWDRKKSFGHLTSGGTLANYQSLYYHKTAKLLPVAVAMACKENNLKCNLPSSLWELLNLPEENLFSAMEEFSKHPVDLTPYTESHLGERGFIEKAERIFNEKFPRLAIIVPKTAHYSWRRAARIFSLGIENIIDVEIDENAKISKYALAMKLDECLQQKIAIIQAVAIFGSTEFGSFDPIDQIVEARDEFLKKGIYFPIHIDAAYGGYFQTLFKTGKEHSNQKIIDDPYYDDLKRSSKAIEMVDSITIDPHKLGMTPYGAGAFVLRNGFLKEYVTIDAHYVFSSKRLETENNTHLGRYILEGSKPGAAAAAVYFSHKIMPLNFDGHGYLLYQLAEIARSFIKKLENYNQKQDRFKFVPIICPQSNVISFVVVRSDAKTIKDVDDLNTFLYQAFGLKKKSSIHHYNYLISHTSMGTEERAIKKVASGFALKNDIERLTILRVVFMNTWVNGKNEHGVSYLDDFIDTLAKKVEKFDRSYIIRDDDQNDSTTTV